MSTTASYSIVGMTCQHCVASVTEELSEIAGVTAVDVDLDTGIANVTSDAPLEQEQVQTAVNEAGYELG